VEALNSYKYAPAQETGAPDLQAIYEKAFAEGKLLGSKGVKVREVVKWQTKEVTTPTGPCPSISDNGIDLKAEVTEAQVETVDGSLYLTGKVRVSLAYTPTNWQADVELPLGRQHVDFKLAKPEPPPVDHKWHVGKAVGCGVGVIVGVQAYPSTAAGIGVGVMCGISWGLVKR